MIVANQSHKAEVEAVFNHPAVRETAAFDGAPEFDATPYLTDPHIALLVNGGCFLGAWDWFGRFECHTAFLPDARGGNAIVECRKALQHVFLHTLCHEVVTKVPQCNPQARTLAKMMGFRFLFSRANVWLKNGQSYGVEYYCLDVETWIVQGYCRPSGEWFHKTLHERYPDLAQHPVDVVHDSYAGAVVDMIKAGNTDKAILFYNRWARLAGYREIVKVSDQPLVLDLTDFKLTVKDGDFSVGG